MTKPSRKHERRGYQVSCVAEDWVENFRVAFATAVKRDKSGCAVARK